MLFAHPHCSCTRASLAELQVVRSRQTAPLQTHVVFVQLPGFSDEVDLSKPVSRDRLREILTEVAGRGTGDGRVRREVL